MAQDWHSAFLTDYKEKDVLSIETHEMVGVLMASVKNLNQRVKELESKLGFI